MRKFVTFAFAAVLVFALSAPASAQWLLSGTTSFESRENPEDGGPRTTAIDLAPVALYNIGGFYVGGGLDVAHAALSGASATDFCLSPAVLRYLGDGSLSPFLSGSYSWCGEGDNTSTGYNLAGGFHFFPNDGGDGFLDIRLAYESNSITLAGEDDAQDALDRIVIRVGAGLKFGAAPGN